jgi:uncharacterized protein YabE (DUF348 family)
MRYLGGLFCVLVLALTGCQSTRVSVTISADGQIHRQTTSERTPALLLKSAGISLGPHDRLLNLGNPVPVDTPLPPASAYSLTVRRAVSVTILSPGSQKVVQTSAQTVGQALSENGYTLTEADQVDPPADTPITGELTIHYTPAETLSISVDNQVLQIHSTAPTVGQALAEAGIPLEGLDYSIPSEDSALPADGKIHVVRVVEAVTLTEQSIPYATRTELSADLALDQQALLQGGLDGLAVTRTRTRLEDGHQVSQQTESQTIVRPPQDQILGYGTKIVMHTATIDGQTITYWRVLTLFATSYSPCRSGVARCLPYTSNGTVVQQGEVAMSYSWYLLFGDQRLYIPGYGFATVEDVGAYPGTHYWIDLGYSDNDYVEWGQNVQVYFLPPVQSNPGYVLP